MQSLLQTTRPGDGLTRRDWLAAGGLGPLGLSLAGLAHGGSTRDGGYAATDAVTPSGVRFLQSWLNWTAISTNCRRA